MPKQQLYGSTTLYNPTDKYYTATLHANLQRFTDLDFCVFWHFDLVPE